MRIALIEPYFSGSHKLWASGLKQYSNHKIEIISLPGKYWKWRMMGGAITLANEFMELDYNKCLGLSTKLSVPGIKSE